MSGPLPFPSLTPWRVGSRVSSMLALAAGLTLLLTQACIPAVLHSPRIDGGLTAGVAASYTSGPKRTRADWGDIAYAYGPLGLNAGYGWTSDRIEGLGVRLGVNVPLLVALTQPDLYVQLPRRVLIGLDGGVGVTLVPGNGIVMPYAQLGALRAGGSGIYATYGFISGSDASDVVLSGESGAAAVPGIAFQKVNGRTTTRAFVIAIIARDRRCSEGVTDCARRDNWSVATGMEVEIRRRKRP